MHYAVPLEAAPGQPPASTFSSWGYLLDGGRCLGLGVTTIVKGKAGDPEQPDPDDLRRLERVYELMMDGVRPTPGI
jgi:hypothetical protein